MRFVKVIELAVVTRQKAVRGIKLHFRIGISELHAKGCAKSTTDSLQYVTKRRQTRCLKDKMLASQFSISHKEMNVASYRLFSNLLQMKVATSGFVCFNDNIINVVVFITFCDPGQWGLSCCKQGKRTAERAE